MPRLTLEEIAKLAGVSRSTVSRVVNDHPNVRSSVRTKVQEIITETGFQPNQAARSLRSKQSNIIGLVIPESVHTLFTDPYFPLLTQGVAQACNAGKKTLALFIESDIQTLIPRVTDEGQLGGVILQAGKLGNILIDKLLEAGMPFVVAGRPGRDDVHFIDVENDQGAVLAVRHLFEQGNRRIATITGALNTTAGLDRLTGYRGAIAENGLEYQENLVREGDFTEQGAYHAAVELLEEHPDAIFVASDVMARGAIRAINDAGLAVPGDIAVVGFDDLPPAVALYPRLTTIHQPVRSFGFKAVELLLKRMGGQSDRVPLQTYMPVELVVRDTSLHS
jgi:LacI family transcriptional regulator